MGAVERFLGEMWTLFALAAAFTGLRLFARVRAVGFKHLQADDYLTCAAMLFYAGETGIASYGGTLYLEHGGEALSPQKLALLPASHPAHKIWVKGAQLHFASWPMYATTLWLLKASLFVLFQRLTAGLFGGYRTRATIGFVMLITTYILVIVTPFVACRPFSRYWQIKPFPPIECRTAVSPAIVWITYTTNVVTDLYLMFIPIPMLWETTMQTWKKAGLGVLFSGGIVVVIFATVRCVLITTDPENGAPVSGTWAVRETFVAVFTANLPMAFTLVKGLLGPAFKTIRSSGHTDRADEMQPVPLQTFGSSSKQDRKDRSVHRSNPTATNMIFSESEERIVYGDSPHLSRDTLSPDGGKIWLKEEER